MPAVRSVRDAVDWVQFPAPRMNREQLKQYFISFLLALEVAAVFSLYLFLRRGYFDSHILNKVLASTSLVLLGIVLLIGPVSRFYNRFDRWLLWRREIGIMAFFLALTHGIISYSGKTSPALLWGFVSLAIMAVLFLTSYKAIEKRLNRNFWVKLQSWGVRMGTLFAFFHLWLLKYPGWIKWLEQGGTQDLARPDFPPASLLGALFLTFVVITRLGEILGSKIARRIFEIGFIVLVLVIIALFI